MMSDGVRKFGRGLLAAGICFALMAHCGNVTINKKIARTDIPAVGRETKLS